MKTVNMPERKNIRRKKALRLKLSKPKDTFDWHQEVDSLNKSIVDDARSVRTKKAR